MYVPVSLTQLVGIMNNICKVWGSNPSHKIKNLALSIVMFMTSPFSYLKKNQLIIKLEVLAFCKWVFSIVCKFVHVKK